MSLPRSTRESIYLVSLPRSTRESIYLVVSKGSPATTGRGWISLPTWTNDKFAWKFFLTFFFLPKMFFLMVSKIEGPFDLPPVVLLNIF